MDKDQPAVALQGSSRMVRGKGRWDSIHSKSHYLSPYYLFRQVPGLAEMATPQRQAGGRATKKKESDVYGSSPHNSVKETVVNKFGKRKRTISYSTPASSAHSTLHGSMGRHVEMRERAGPRQLLKCPQGKGSHASARGN